MSGDTPIPITTALTLMLCRFAQDNGGTLTIVEGGLQVYPGDGRWYAAGTYDGPIRLASAGSPNVTIESMDGHTVARQTLSEGPEVETEDSDRVIRAVLVLELAPIDTGELPSGLYFVCVEFGGQQARLPFIVPAYADVDEEQ